MAKQGNIILGIIVGSILLAILGWIPILGGLIAGVVAGAIARGAGRGIVTGFISGIIGLIALTALFGVIGSALGGSIGAAIGSAIGVGASVILGLLEIGNIFLATIGGLIGGAVSPREITVQVVNQPKEQEHEKVTKNEDDAISTLKLRYANGEITKKQYNQMKKDLETQ